MSRSYDLIVVGGGVAGLVAAGVAASRGERVLLLEKMEKPARKLRITGKGRCNLTNLRPREEFFEKIRQGADFFRPAFEAFDNRATVQFFESIGLPLVCERGERLFPASGRAWDVADALVRWCREQGVELLCQTPVGTLNIEQGAVAGVATARGDYAARRVILCTGGVSYPATGSTGDGHQFAHDAGHRIVPLRPALVPVEVALSPRTAVALRNVRLSLRIDGAVADERFGEMELHDGVAEGAIVLQVSRTAVDAFLDGKRVELAIDLKPALTADKLAARLARERQVLAGGTLRQLLGKLLPAGLHAEVAERLGCSLSKSAGLVRDEALIGLLKEFRMEMTDYRPFTEAIVTAGGVDLSQVNPQTLESRLVGGLYFAGELLDLDADTGGYNLQIALSTGYLAGRGK